MLTREGQSSEYATHFQLLLCTPSEHIFVVLHWDKVNMKKWPSSAPSSFLYNSRSNFNVNSNNENKLMLNIDAPWIYLLYFPWVVKIFFSSLDTEERTWTIVLGSSGFQSWPKHLCSINAL